jgi:hypothetical protein
MGEALDGLSARRCRSRHRRSVGGRVGVVMELGWCVYSGPRAVRRVYAAAPRLPKTSAAGVTEWLIAVRLARPSIVGAFLSSRFRESNPCRKTQTVSRAKSGGVRTTGTCAPGPITYQPGRSKADVQLEQGGIPIVDPRRREMNPNDEAKTTEKVRIAARKLKRRVCLRSDNSCVRLSSALSSVPCRLDRLRGYRIGKVHA